MKAGKRSLIENAVRAAALAPSEASQQPWSFVFVSSPELKRRLREAAEAEERESYERRMSQEWLDALAPLGTDWHKPHITDAPYVIVVFEQPYGLAEGPDGVTRVKHYYVRESVGLAVGFLLASLTHAGLCTLTHTPSPMAFLATLLGRPNHERPYRAGSQGALTDEPRRLDSFVPGAAGRTMLATCQLAGRDGATLLTERVAAHTCQLLLPGVLATAKRVQRRTLARLKARLETQ